MKPCCRDEARRNLEAHRDVARCDGCGRLLLAYGNEKDFESTREELERHQVAFETEVLGKLKIIAKA